MRQRRAFITFPETLGNDPSLLREQKKIDGVNIKFSVETFSPVGVASTAYITVFNLNRDDLDYLTTTTNSWLKKRNLIQLYAGYDDDLHLLFSGQIMNAPSQGNPDVGIDIRGLASVDWMSKQISFQKRDVRIVDLIDYLKDETGATLNLPKWLRDGNEWLNKKLEEYSYTGTPMGLVQKISDMMGGFSFNKNSVNININDNEINVWSALNQKDGNVWLISEETGMIGYPAPTTGGCTVRTLLNPNIKAGDLIRVRSKRLKLCNTDYFVVGIKHDGELRGNAWYTTLSCSLTSNWQKDLEQNV